MKRWFDIKARSKGAEIAIYDEIGAFGLPAKAFLEALRALGPVPELTLRINSLGGSVFDGFAIYNALKRHEAKKTVWIDGLAASIASLIAMAGDEVVMPANAMLMLHDPSGVVMGTAQDMRGMAEALEKMKAGMVGAYCAKSGRGEAEIEALLAAESWLTADEALVLGLADRIEAPVRMAACFDLSRFHHPPPQLAALAFAQPQETEMLEPQTRRACKTPPIAQADEETPPVTTDEPVAEASAPAMPPPLQPAPPPPEPPATAQVIDLDGIRAEERRATLAYVGEVHELCALGRCPDQAAGFIARATPVAQVRRALLEARAAEDEASTIRGQARTSMIEAAAPSIDTAAIYAARNQHAR